MKTLIAIVAMLAAAFLAGCGDKPSAAPAAEPPTITAQVLVELRWPLIADTLDSEASAPEQCAGGLDYAKITTGSVVSFKDADGSIVGTADLSKPKPSDNVVICTWLAETQLESESKFFTAEVGGWTSAPQTASGGKLIFHLDTIDEDPGGGSTAQVDPAWTRG